MVPDPSRVAEAQRKPRFARGFRTAGGLLWWGYYGAAIEQPRFAAMRRREQCVTLGAGRVGAKRLVSG